MLIQIVPQAQLLMSIAGIIGAGIASYVGVRVAITEIRGKISTHDQKFTDGDRRQSQIESRLERLESGYFRNRDRT